MKINQIGLTFKWLAIYVSCCCWFGLTACSSNIQHGNLLSAQVTRVVSGQTIEVTLQQTPEVTQVRIIGIDAPDLRQSPWGAAAKAKLAELVMGLPIQLELESTEQDFSNLSSRDRFNRINAHIWQDQTLVSQQLVKEGCVLANTEDPHLYSKLLINAQEDARLLGYGIWNPEQAMHYTPNQFRSNLK